jgi:hypothetical protein
MLCYDDSNKQILNTHVESNDCRVWYDENLLACMEQVVADFDCIGAQNRDSEPFSKNLSNNG